MTFDPYVDATTGVLRNNLGISDADALFNAVADISAARLDQLAAQPLPGLYDLKHLQRFHKVIFGDVFPWAGDIRTVQIFKTTGFCLPQHIEDYAASEFAKPARERYLRGLPIDRFVERLAYYVAEVNEMPPFREGNGRAQRAFFRQLAVEAGYGLDWTVVGAGENVKAAVAAHQGDMKLLRQMLVSVVKPLAR